MWQSKRFAFFTLSFSLLLSFCMSSCSVDRRTRVRQYPTDTPFVFQESIELQTPNGRDEKRRLQTELANYWDDSLRSPKSTEFGILYRLKNPPIFDTVNISRSIGFMNNYLRSQGYYHPQFSDTFYVKQVRDQKRAYVKVTINTGKNTVLDSISYILSDTTLQQLALANHDQSVLRKGLPFSKELVAAELDRLVGIYRNNGYMRISRDNFFAEVDTLDQSLLVLTTDPLEQAALLSQAQQRKKENPTLDLEIRQRPVNDSSLIRDSTTLKRYYVGGVYFYPEASPTELPDSLINRRDFREISRREFTMRYYDGLFRYRPLREHTYLRRGRLYNEEEYYRTLNSFSQIGSWQQVDGRLIPRGDSVDVHLFMVPALQQGYTADLELSRNTGDFLGGNLAGIAANFIYRHRNLWRSAVQSNTYLRTGVELSLNNKTQTNYRFLQTILGNVGHTFIIPRIALPAPLFRTFFGNRAQYNGMRTIINANVSYNDRFQFYRLRSLNTSFGYEWTKRKLVWRYLPVNVELYSLDTLQRLRDAFATNGFLRTAFNTGSVVSQLVTASTQWESGNAFKTNHYLRVGLEEAGGILSIVKSLRSQLYRYVKLDAEYRRLIQLGSKRSLALRAIGGVGYNYGTANAIDSTLPFFKQFVAGGPNSMRAWNLRQIGLGSSLVSDTSSSFRDRFGDMQLELNAEYRFNLAQISSLKIASCLFTDVGNIWNLRANTANPNTAFRLRNLGRDLAIAVGTGLRLDFSFFLIRLDFGLKLKDPARLTNNGWLDFKNFTWRNREFEEANRPVRNNYAIQLGIGMPF